MTSELATVQKTILKLERAALDRWGKGDPDCFLEINAGDVSYFDPFLEQRLDGLPALTDWYSGIRGNIKIDRDEIIDPRVKLIGDAAILTCRFVSQGSEGSRAGTPPRSISGWATSGRSCTRTGRLRSRRESCFTSKARAAASSAARALLQSAECRR